MHDRSEWTKGESGAQVIKGKSYRNLVQFTRACATCGQPFSIFVTAKIASGHADSNSFGLKNCEAHRRNRPNGESEEFRTANVTMREELTGLYERVRLQFEEIQVLKARLAKYELPAAFEALGCEAVQNTSNGMAPNSLTFPWLEG